MGLGGLNTGAPRGLKTGFLPASSCTVFKQRNRFFLSRFSFCRSSAECLKKFFARLSDLETELAVIFGNTASQDIAQRLEIAKDLLELRHYVHDYAEFEHVMNMHKYEDAQGGNLYCRSAMVLISFSILSFFSLMDRRIKPTVDFLREGRKKMSRKNNPPAQPVCEAF